MEKTVDQQRSIASIVGALVLTLVAIRIYNEFLFRRIATIEIWAFREKWPLVGFAIATVLLSASAAWFTHRNHKASWALMAAIVGGALAAAPLNALWGIAAGFVVGLVTVNKALQRLLGRHVLPSMLVGTFAGMSLTRWYYTLPSLERFIWLAIGVLLLPIAIAIFLFGIPSAWPGLRNRSQTSTRPQASYGFPNPFVRKVPRTVFRIALHCFATTVAIVYLAASLWCGREVEINRRILSLRLTGSQVYTGSRFGNAVLWKGTTNVTHVELEERASSKHFRMLSAFPKLVFVQVNGSAVEDSDLVITQQLPDLYYLELYNCPVTDAGIERLIGHPTIDHLILSGTQCSSRVLGIMANEVASLTIQGLVGECRPADLQALTASKSITWLNLVDLGLTDELFMHLTPLPRRLHHLSLARNQITRSGLEEIGAIESPTTRSTFSSLDLSGNPISVSDLDSIQHLSLTTVELATPLETIDDRVPKTEHFAGLLSMRDLHTLRVPDLHITDSTLRLLISKLTDLDVGGKRLQGRFPIGDDGVEFRVHVEDEYLRAEDIARLASYDQNTILSRCELSPGAIAEFANYDRMFWLEGCTFDERFRSTLQSYVNIASP